MPAKILEIVDREIPLVKVDVGRGLVKILPSLMQDPRVGDYVMVYGGAVIERMDVETYNDTIKLWQQATGERLQVIEQQTT
ncbi:MAG: HypC/HybG/HupF family hydrogenase formation chaperone [Nitrososphaerales archaeon]|nr:HypC/HybG/HupF family hydrogenase formation chaperone [Nitrososphaerales archaeon]